MKYNVSKEQYATILRNHPSLIKKITSLDEDMAAYLILHSRACYEYLPYELRASVKVVRAYVHETKEEAENTVRHHHSPTHHSLFRHVRIYDIPKSVFAEMTLKERKRLIKLTSSSCYRNIIESFTETVYEEWLEVARNGYTYLDKIPKEFHDRKTLYMAMADYLKHWSTEPDWTIPEVFWTKGIEKANDELTEMIECCPKTIKTIPPKRITSHHLVAAFQSGDLLLDEEEYREIPQASWNQTNARLALKANPRNICVVPELYLSEDIAIAVADEKIKLGYFPESLLTRTVRVHIVAYNTDPYKRKDPFGNRDEENKDLFDPSFQLDVVRVNGVKGVENIEGFIKPENRNKILEICPQFLKYIPKLEQTDETIETFLMHASIEEIDWCAEFINLGKIRRKHAPLFVGCENNLIITMMEKKLKGSQKKRSTGQQQDTKQTGGGVVEIDVAPAEFAKIRDQLK